MVKDNARSLRIAALGLALTVLIAACSSSKSGGKSATGDATSKSAGSASPTPTGTPIRIGYAVAESGFAAGTGTMSTVAVGKAWAAWVNANGGIQGHPVELVVEDTQSSGATTQQVVSDLVEKEKVDAIAIGDGSDEAVVSSYLAKQNIAVIGTAGVTPAEWTQPNFFLSTTNSPWPGVGLAQAAKSAGVTSMGAMVCAESPTCALVAQLVEPAAAKLGVSFTGVLTTAATAPSYLAPCLTMIQKHTQLIYAASSGPVVVREATDCLQQGFTGYFGQVSLSLDTQLLGKVSGLKVLGTLSAFPWWSSAAPVAQFRDLINKYAPNTNYQNNAATAMWTALQLFRKAMSSGTQQDVTRQSIIDAYYTNVKNETLDGLLAEPITYTKGKPGPDIRGLWLYKWQAGDKDPTSLPVSSGTCNSVTGDLASTSGDPSRPC